MQLLGSPITLPDDSVIRAVYQRQLMDEREPYTNAKIYTHMLTGPTDVMSALNEGDQVSFASPYDTAGPLNYVVNSVVPRAIGGVTDVELTRAV